MVTAAQQRGHEYSKGLEILHEKRFDGIMLLLTELKGVTMYIYVCYSYGRKFHREVGNANRIRKLTA